MRWRPLSGQGSPPVGPRGRGSKTNPFDRRLDVGRRIAQLEQHVHRGRWATLGVAAASTSVGLGLACTPHVKADPKNKKKDKPPKGKIGSDEETFISNASLLFDAIDTDGGGTLSKEELEEFAASLQGTTGLSDLAKDYLIPGEFLRALLQIGGGSDREVDREEFTDFLLEKERALRAVFDESDRGKTGELTQDQFVAAMCGFKLEAGDGVLKSMSPATARALLVAADENGDGCINYDEFRAAFLTLSMKDLKNTQPFWGVNLGDSTIVDSKTVQGGTAWRHVLAGLVATLVANTATAPLELAYRLVQSGRSPKGTTSVMKILKHTVAQEGYLGFFKGNLPQVLRCAPTKSLELVFLALSINLLTDPDEDPKESKLRLAGACSGVLTRCLLFPLDTLSMRLSIAPPNTYSNFLQAAYKICRLEGKSALYNGMGACALWSLPLSLMQFTIFAKLVKLAKRNNEEGKLTRFDALSCGLGATWLATSITLPLDTVRRQIQVQCAGGRLPKYMNAVEALIKLSSTKKGTAALFQGFLPMTARLIPFTIVSFTVYELAKDCIETVSS